MYAIVSVVDKALMFDRSYFASADPKGSVLFQLSRDSKS
jgi:hypothetical protein